MKKSLLTTTATIMITVGCFAQNNGSTSGYLTIKGKLDNIKDTLVLFTNEYEEPKDVKVADIITKDGKFEYRLQLDKAKNLSIMLPSSQQKNTHTYEAVSIPALPDEKVELSGSLKNYQITGTKFYKQFANLFSIIQEFIQVSNNERMACNKKLKDVKDENTRNKIISESNANTKASKDKMNTDLKEYLKSHKDEEATIYVATFLDSNDLNTVINTLSPNILNGRLKGVMDGAKARFEAIETLRNATKTIVADNMAPDFTLKDINGNDFTLSSLRGKYVILDFWGSWCHWCIKGMPELKKYYDKYKEKLEVVGIDCHDTVDRWKTAVAKNPMPWLHVKNENKNLIPEKYAVTGFPTKVLINPDGTINETCVGEKTEFYQHLDSLFDGK